MRVTTFEESPTVRQIITALESSMALQQSAYPSPTKENKHVGTTDKVKGSSMYTTFEESTAVTWIIQKLDSTAQKKKASL
eukprot:15281185-Ditylum_brightwellii.AAC.1